MRLPTWMKGAIIFTATLGAGMALGVGYERGRSDRHNGARPDPHHFLQHLSSTLGLDSAQQRAVAAVLAHRQGAVDSTWHAMRPHVRATMDSAHQDIMALLRPEQAAKYRTLIEGMHHEAARAP